MIVAVMTQATFGHTGNALVAAPAAVAAYVLLLAAALLRVFCSVAGADAMVLLIVAALCWVTAFSSILMDYAPMLWRPRADEKPG